jgi:hypothetical protein
MRIGKDTAMPLHRFISVAPVTAYAFYGLPVLMVCDMSCDYLNRRYG